MSSHTPESDLRELWQNLETEKTTVSAEQIRMKAMESLGKNRRDMIARFGFALLASAFCVVALMNAKVTSVRALAALAMAVVLINAMRSAFRSYSGQAAHFGSEDAPWSSCLEFYRRELQRQQVIAALPVWQLVGALLVIGWLAPSAFRQYGAGLMRFFFPAVLIAATGLILLMAVRKYQARHIQNDLQALSNFEDENPGGSDDSTDDESQN
jgi:hypothetical protein